MTHPRRAESALGRTAAAEEAETDMVVANMAFKTCTWCVRRKVREARLVSRVKMVQRSSRQLCT